MSRKHDEMEEIPLDTKSDLNNKSELPVGRPTKKTLRQGLKDIYFEFCSNTSLHGVQYFGQRRPWIEIIFWIIIFVLSIYFCTITIYSVYRKWDETPVIVSFSERSIPISSIPFPAITICPESKRLTDTEGPQYGDLLNNLTEGLGLPSNLTSDELDEFLTLLQLCNNQPVDFESLKSVTPPKPIDYIKIINEMSFPLTHATLNCQWGKRVRLDCDDLFTTTYTEDGLCYTFNGFNGTDLYREGTVQYQMMGLESRANLNTKRITRTLSWSLDKGYSQKAPIQTYPARVVSASSKASLDIALLMYKDKIDYGCSGPTQGFKVVIHTPDDVPLMSKRFVRLSLEKQVTIAVKPVMVTTSGRIEGYSPAKRRCYLAGERELKFFKVYSEKNCELECLTNFTRSLCGCVKFSMPRTPDMEVCGADRMECYQRAEEQLLLANVGYDDDFDYDLCNCIPSCTSLEYDTEISQADLDMDQTLKAMKIGYDMNAKFSTLSVHFKDNEFVTSKRSELFGFSEFLANCGGVFGLFMGFSFLSVVEMLYHLTLRLWSNMTRRDGEVPRI